MSITTANINFIIPPGNEGTYLYINLNADSETGIRERNYELEAKTVEIEDLRGKDYATLDTVGFQLCKRPPKIKSFDNDAAIEREYYPECIELVKELTGASRVVIFNHSTFSTNQQILSILI
jgi:hypothetical protein